MSSFIIPLQNLPDANGRVHTSVNINTETGRLSSRRPNLQNQPALEKDRYKIRKSFQAAPGSITPYILVFYYYYLQVITCKIQFNSFFDN